MKSSVLIYVLLLGFGSLAIAPGAMADDWNLRTIVTFHQPVEIPHMILGPGTYVMKLAEPIDAHIVQFYNRNETHLYAQVMAIPAYRQNLTGQTVITFEERAANSPRAIQKWFYPGHYYGEEFVYPKAEEVAATTPAPTNLQPPTPAPAVKPEAPAPQAAATPEPQPEPVQVAQTTPPPAAAPAPAPKELPKTSSMLPWIALFGSMLFVTGAFLAVAGALSRNTRPNAGRA